MRGQASAEVYYQQSIAQNNPASVILHDPTREKTVALPISGGLQALPESIQTTDYQGKVYFQTLPPPLQQLFYFAPPRGANGSLILIGVFHDVLAGGYRPQSARCG